MFDRIARGTIRLRLRRPKTVVILRRRVRQAASGGSVAALLLRQLGREQLQLVRLGIELQPQAAVVAGEFFRLTVWHVDPSVMHGRRYARGGAWRVGRCDFVRRRPAGRTRSEKRGGRAPIERGQVTWRPRVGRAFLRRGSKNKDL